MAVVGAAPCQCFSPGGNQTTSPGRISSTGPPSRCAQPHPAVTMSVWPSGWVCHAVRAPGSKVTVAPETSAGSGAWKSGSIRTLPVNHSAGPFADGCEPIRLISMFVLLCYSWTQQCLDRPAFVHRAVPFSNLIKRQRQIEYFPGIDLLVQHKIDQLR